MAASIALLSTIISQPSTFLVHRAAVRSSGWLGDRRAVLASVEWSGQTLLCEHDAKAQARLAAELLRFDEVLD